MDRGEMDQLAGEVDALGAALDEERFRHVAGLDPEPSLARPFAARSRAAHRDTVRALRESGEPGLADRVAALRAERAQAEADITLRTFDPQTSWVFSAGADIFWRASNRPHFGHSYS